MNESAGAHDPTEGTLLSHLLELRDRLIRAVVAVLLVFAVLVIFRQEIYRMVALPLIQALPEGGSMIATEVASPFLTPVKLAFWVSVIVAMPYLLYQLWAFVAPGLYRHERRVVMPLLVSSVLLFYLGMAFAYFVVFPLAFSFFTAAAPEGVQVMTDIRAYLDFVFGMFFAFGLAFEVPVAIVLLAKAGVVEPEALARKRPYVVLWTFVIAMLITPPDVFSQTLLAIPMLALFEIGLFVARRVAPRDGEADEEGAMTEEEMEAELDRAEAEGDKGRE